jgi:perosamine synthetase
MRPLIRRTVRRSPAAKGLEHVRIETDELNRTLTSRPSLAAFAEWAPKLACIDNWVAQRLGVAQIYRRRSAEAPGAVIVGSCFTNFPVIVPRERAGTSIAQ